MLAFTVSGSYATNLYVSGSGSDSNDGSEATPWKTIQFAINSAASGDVIFVQQGTYSEVTTITKPITLTGVSSGGVKPLLTGAATPSGLIAGYVLSVNSPNVTISNFTIEVDQSFQYYGIKAGTSGINNLTVTDCDIYSTGPAATGVVYYDSWGIYAQSVGTDLVTLKRNNITPKSLAHKGFGRAIRILGPNVVIGGPNPADGNTTVAYYGMQIGNPGGAFVIQNNTFTGYGVELHSYLNNYSGLIADNTFTTLNSQNIAAELEIKDVRSGNSISVTRNAFTNYSRFALMVEKSSNISINDNDFTPKDTGVYFAAVFITNKLGSGGASQQASGTTANVSVTNNRFNGPAADSVNGYAVALANFNWSPSVAPFQNVTIGGSIAGQENKFAGNLEHWITLDTSNGTSDKSPAFQLYLPATPTHPVTYSLDASGNKFEVNGVYKFPSAMTTAELFTAEDKIQHSGDADSLGFVTLVSGHAYVTGNSSIAPVNSASDALNRIQARLADGATVHTNATSFTSASVTKNFTLSGQSAVTIGALALTSGKTLTLGSQLNVSGSLNLSSGFVNIGNNNLVLSSAATVSNASSNGYVITEGTGKLTRKGVGITALLFPVGSADGYAPVTFTDVLSAPSNDDISVKVNNTDNIFDFTPALPGTVTKFVAKQWDITEAVPGGNNATLKFAWPASSEVNGPLNVGTYVDHYTGGTWVPTVAVYGSNSATAIGFSSFSPFAVHADGVSNLNDLTINSDQSVNGTYNNVTITGSPVVTLSAGLTVYGNMTVPSGATLITDCNTIDGPGTFTLQAGGTLAICNTDGIERTAFAGAVQTTGTRSFSNDANYEYNGTAAQSTGGGLPSKVRNLTINNGNGVGLSAASSVNQVLTLTNGTFSTNSRFTLLSNAAGTGMVVYGDGDATGTVKAQRYIDPSFNSGLGYRHYSSPVSGQSLNGLSSTTGGFSPVLNTEYNTSPRPGLVLPFPNVFAFDPSLVTASADTFSKGWFVPTGSMAAGTGYSVNIDAGQTLQVSGTLNNSEYSVNVDNNGAANGGWAFVGNPYAAPINFANMVNNNMESAVYTAQSTSQYDGRYGSYVNGVSNNGGSPIVSSMQGFFVKAKAGGGDVNFDPSARLTSYANPSFYRNASSELVRLSLSAAGSVTDETVVYFQNSCTEGFDAMMDAGKVHTGGVALYTLHGNRRFSINGQPVELLNSMNVRIPLGYTATAAQQHTITALEAPGDWYIVDYNNMQVHALPYTFGTSAGRFENRLELVRNTSILSVKPTVQLMNMFPNPATGKIQVSMPGISKLTLLDAAGKVSFETEVNNDAVLDIAHLPAGVYTVRCLHNGGMSVQKLVKQ
ncbi:MAG: T9SS type A sorting domain-containing protein [Bacteroidota bacterium]